MVIKLCRNSFICKLLKSDGNITIYIFIQLLHGGGSWCFRQIKDWQYDSVFGYMQNWFWDKYSNSDVWTSLYIDILLNISHVREKRDKEMALFPIFKISKVWQIYRPHSSICCCLRISHRNIKILFSKILSFINLPLVFKPSSRRLWITKLLR